MKQVIILNNTKAVEIGSRILLADTHLTRMVGLLGKQQLDAGCGILIKPSSGVHTFGMRFPIDVIALDKHLRVVLMWHDLSPNKITRVSFAVRSVLEIPAGQIRKSHTELGDQLEVIPMTNAGLAQSTMNLGGQG